MALLVLSGGTIGAGLYFGHFYAVSVFAAWLAIEFILWRFPLSRKLPRVAPGGPTSSIPYVLSLYRRADAASETLLAQKISDLKVEGSLSDREQRVLERLKDLAQLRGLAFGGIPRARHRLRHAFAYTAETRPETAVQAAEGIAHDHFSLAEITDAATVVADLYWKLLDTCENGFPELTRLARLLYTDLFGVAYEPEAARRTIGSLTDSMQRDWGVPYLILNLIRMERLAQARAIAQDLLTRELEMEDELRSSLYWISEISWFGNEKGLILSDFDASIRYLYHLCFTNAERAGFLEIDSRFFSQFETVSELAREGFLFKESLFDKVLGLWGDHEGFFDGVFCAVLEAMTQSRSKIYRERDSWVSFWKRERESFVRDYLFVIEGNLMYAGGHYEDALQFYDKALKANPHLRAAQLNIVFALAQLGLRERHERAVERLVSDRSLHPAALYVAGNSYLLLGDTARAEAYYEALRKVPGWERKVDYYKSTFCFENALYEKALEFARLAHEQNPTDSSISYHLSLCYNVLGEKDRALDAVKKIENGPERSEWLNYYRFTLERDAGRDLEASQTLLRIPSDYFEDPDELEEALEFARGRKDLVLLRHLHRRRD